MYVSGIRVSSFLTIMYLWNGKKHTYYWEKKQYNNVVVLNVQSLFEKEETSKNSLNCSWTVPISQQKGCAEIEHTQNRPLTH